MEVAERGVHHTGFDVTEHASTTEDVEAESIQARSLAARQRVGMEVEDLSDPVDRFGGLDDLERLHAGDDHTQPVTVASWRYEL